MNRSWRLLSAFLLAAVPAGAQIRAVAPAFAPALAAPSAAVGASVSALTAPSLSAAPALAAPLSAAALLAAPAPVLPASALAAPAPAAASALAAAPAGASAPALAAVPLAAAVDGFSPKRAFTGAAEPPTISFGGKLFDGSSELFTRSGSVFTPARTEHPRIPGGVAFVRVRPAPAAPRKAVADTQGLSGSALLDRVSMIAAKGQIRHEYKEASHYLFSTADNHALNGVHGVADAYSGIFVPGTSADGHDYTEKGDADGDGYSRDQGMNVEHVFPQSLFHQDLPMRSDLHHLMATFEHPNGMRGSLPFGMVTGATEYRNNAGAKRGGNHFEPPDFSKGRVARAMLYFYTRYKDSAFMEGRAASFWNGQIETLLDWNRRFPPTVEERTRNDQVEAFQGNRNPFVDDNGLADRIGADAFWAGTRTERPEPRLTLRGGPGKRSDKPRKGSRRSVSRLPSPRFSRR